MLRTFTLTNWQEPSATEVQQEALAALESGEVLYLPQLSFELLPQEERFLSADYASPKTKNISFNIKDGSFQGAICNKDEGIDFSHMLKRYAEYAKALVKSLLPYDESSLEQGRTSYRPVEIASRKAPSYRKDDTRLHVDAFPSTPMQGKRILRVFTNVNPNNKPRTWRLGAPFPKVVEYFYPSLKRPFLGSARVLNTLKITKTLRTQYDHYMLQLHNAMKADVAYQVNVPQLEFKFPAGSTWVVFTDQVSHAAMAGQFTFEQSFYLLPEALIDINKSPCKVLEKFLQRPLL